MIKRTLATLAALALACGLTACGGGNGTETHPVEYYLPASGEVAGWTEDTTQGVAGRVESAHDVDAAEAYIDGSIDPFVDTGAWVAMAWEYYVNGANTVELRLYELGHAAANQQAYIYLQTHPDGTPWELLDPPLGDEGRIADQGTYWKIHTLHGVYFLESHTWPGDEPTEAIATSFAAAVLAKLP